MESIRLNTREAIIILTLIGAGIGLLLGLVPLIYGRIKGKGRLGLIGFVVSIIAGTIWSILPLFVMITFVFLIIRDRETRPVEVKDLSGNPNEEADADLDNK